MLSDDPDGTLAKVREAARRLPEMEERLSHGQPSFFVDDRMFAHFRHDHHGDGRTTLCVKTGGIDEQEALIEADPERYSRPAYLAGAGWIGLSLAGEVDWPHVEDRVARSWELAAPRRLLEAGGR